MKGTDNPAAWAAYLEGQRSYSVIEKEKMEASLAHFEFATVEDSNFARAWGHRAYGIARSVMEGWDHGTLDDALGHAKTAVRLDGSDYTTYWDLGFVHVNRGEFGEGMPAYAMALDLYENNTDMLDRKHGLLADMAEAQNYNGNRPAAFDLLKRAQRIPDWYRWIHGFAYFSDGQYEEAIKELHRMTLKPGDDGYVPSICLVSAAAYALLGKTILARTHIDMFNRMRDSSLPPYTLADAAQTGVFNNSADNDHFIEGLRLAGIPGADQNA